MQGVKVFENNFIEIQMFEEPEDEPDIVEEEEKNESGQNEMQDN